MLFEKRERRRGRGKLFREKCTKSNSSARRFVLTYMDSMIRVGGKSERGDICTYIYSWFA